MCRRCLCRLWIIVVYNNEIAIYLDIGLEPIFRKISKKGKIIVMSQTKQKTKMKTGTVAIIALSMILVLSLVATITLAYFSASRNVVTTVRFANGVSLQMYGAAFKETGGNYSAGDPDAPPSASAATLYWLAKTTQGNGGTMSNNTTIQGGYEDVNDVLEFQNLRIRTVDADAYVAFKLIVTAVDASSSPVTLQGKAGFALPTPTTNWKVYDSTTQGTGGTAVGANWYVYTGNNATIQKLDDNGVTASTAGSTQNTESAFELIYGNYGTNSDEGYKIPTASTYMNDFAGLTFTFTLVIVAADTQAGLNDMITGATAAGISNVPTCDAYGTTPSP